MAGDFNIQATHGRHQRQADFPGSDHQMAHVPRLPNHEPLRLLHDFRGYVGRGLANPVCALQEAQHHDGRARSGIVIDGNKQKTPLVTPAGFFAW